MRKIKVNHVELAYRDEGSGDSIIFLHAFPLNQTMWDEQVSAFASTHRVITLDWRGFGKSELGGGVSTMDVFAEDLAGLINELGIERSVICGLSMGGYAAFAFYRRYAERVSGLILADTKATADTEEAKRGRYETAELARRQGSTALVGSMTPKLLGATTLEKKPAIAQRIKSMIESSQAEGIARALIGMAQRDDSTELLAKIDCPTLIIVGGEDKLTPPSEAEKMSQAISGSKLEVIAEAGHLPNLEQPEKFNHALKQLVTKTRNP